MSTSVGRSNGKKARPRDWFRLEAIKEKVGHQIDRPLFLDYTFPQFLEMEQWSPSQQKLTTLLNKLLGCETRFGTMVLG